MPAPREEGPLSRDAGRQSRKSTVKRDPVVTLLFVSRVVWTSTAERLYMGEPGSTPTSLWRSIEGSL
jgi:hypothetical protein